MKKLLMLLLSVVLAFSAVACNDPGKDDTISYYYIITPDVGYGTEGLKELVRLFEEEHATTSYAERKTGVDVELTVTTDMLQVTNMKTEPYHAYISPYSVSQSMIGGGDFLNIDEYFYMEIPGDGKTLDDKISDDYKLQLVATDGENVGDYYFLPGLGFGGGLSYDKHMFDKEGFYFVAPGQEGDGFRFDCTILNNKSYYFASATSTAYKEAIDTPARDSWEGWNANRYLSCGPDGVYGTYDDGMPSSIEELIVLCDRIKDVTPPFVVSGKGGTKGNMMPAVDALVCSLLGEDNARAMTYFESDSFEVVTGYQENTSLWGMSDVMLPKTTNVKITESQGYYVTWSSARYYVTAFIKLATEQGWFADSINGSVDHEAAQNMLLINDYLNGNYKGAILFESSYWVNESQESSNYEYFNIGGYTDDEGNEMTSLEREKEIKWMSLPRQLAGTVSEGNGTSEIFMQNQICQLNLFNARYEDDPEALEIIKDWILFLYRDENLQYLTATTGCTYNLDYDKNTDSSAYDNDPFYKDYFTRVDNGGVEIRLESDKKTFNSNTWQFGKHYWNSCWTGLESERKTTLYEVFNPTGSLNYSIYKAFQGDSKTTLLLTKENWASYYSTDGSSNDMPPTSAYYPDGSEVLYNKR